MHFIFVIAIVFDNRHLGVFEQNDSAKYQRIRSFNNNGLVKGKEEPGELIRVNVVQLWYQQMRNVTRWQIMVSGTKQKGTAKTSAFDICSKQISKAKVNKYLAK